MSSDVEQTTRLPSTTAIICCYSQKRWNDLCEAIESIRTQSSPVQQIIVVVDHNDALRARLDGAFPGLTIIENTRPRGLSGARNTGIATARGDCLLFLDDDAVAEPDMLARLSDHLRDPHVLGAVARIVPVWQSHVPAWFPDEFLWVVGCTYKGMLSGSTRNLLGAAMFVRRHIFETVGGFNSGLGRGHAALPLGCEETEFCIRANVAFSDSHFTYVDSTMCFHKVQPERGTWKYLASRCYAEGLSKAHVAFIAQAAGSLSSEKVYVTRTVPLGMMRSLGAFVQRGEMAGLGRIAAAVLGLSAAALGYAVGRSMLLLDRGRALELRRLPTALPAAAKIAS